jgi:hypothetical protein
MILGIKRAKISAIKFMFEFFIIQIFCE